MRVKRSLVAIIIGTLELKVAYMCNPGHVSDYVKLAKRDEINELLILLKQFRISWF
ncbi:hypothetical protein BDF14DRAFT_1821160 [Spinellus fusiger]|nr:hypothetical protein BDF14DRAFT_1821160 [Spinellus fusiger]